jgi:hypothetical protein
MMRRIAAALAAALVVALALPTLAQPTQLVRFTGQLLDVRNGYVYFTSGDAFKLAPAPLVADYDTGKPTTLVPRAKLFARAILDPATKAVVELDLTTRRLPADAAYAPEVQAAVATRPFTTLAPEIAGVYHSGKEVPVEFLVTVPPTTPLNAEVYVSTDASGWNPQAIKLDRVDGQRYRTVRRIASGTKFVFRVTRGSWATVEVGENGLVPDPHTFVVREVDSFSSKVTVFGWSDDRGNAVSVPAAPGAIPTPFNPNPFPPGGIAPPSRATPPGGFPTPRPHPPNQPPR